MSIGSDGDPSFENAVHAYAPHCHIETHDGTLTGKRAKLREQLPSYIHFVPENMHAETWRRWGGEATTKRMMHFDGRWAALRLYVSSSIGGGEGPATATLPCPSSVTSTSTPPR